MYIYTYTKIISMLKIVVRVVSDNHHNNRPHCVPAAPLRSRPNHVPGPSALLAFPRTRPHGVLRPVRVLRPRPQHFGFA